MAGLAGLALGTVPIAGGAVLGLAAGQFKGPDFRALIKQDQDLLDRIPQEQTARRAELQRIIDMRIDDLIGATDQSRSLREAASAYKGNWRDVVLVVCIVLFAVIWWNVPHSRTNWLPTLIVLILLGMVATVYAVRGVIRGLNSTMHRHQDPPVAVK
jgi:F0F1-type ATP synthase assembly protein I